MQGETGGKTTKILSTKICFWAEFGKTVEYFILENFTLYGISYDLQPRGISRIGTIYLCIPTVAVNKI